MTFQVLLIFASVALAVAYVIPVHHHHTPQPYNFGYSVKDHHGEQHREESGDGHSGVRGSYGFSDARGVHRQVNYVADHGGFRAVVNTNEPGTANQDPAAVNMMSSAPHVGDVGIGYGAASMGYRTGVESGSLGYGRMLGYGMIGGSYSLGNGGFVYGLGGRGF